MNSEFQYDLICGDRSVARSFERRLEPHGLSMQSQANTALLIDLPSGFALAHAEQLKGREVVALTQNACEAYLDDLWEHNPVVLLYGEISDVQVPKLANYLRNTHHGYRCRNLKTTSSLSAGERSLLRYSALGYTNKHIGRQLDLNEQSVKNGLNRVYKKIGVTGRVQAALYYWGIWGDFSPPVLQGLRT